MTDTVKVRGRQDSSRSCFVCGNENSLGFQAQFYEMENGQLVCLVTPRPEYQSYPGRLHGGIASTLLDEVMGRAIMIAHPDVWGVTTDMTLQYRRPVPLDQTLRITARITRDRLRFDTEGEILLEDGTVAVTARGRYLKMPVNRIVDGLAQNAEILYHVPLEREPAAISCTGPLEVEYAI